MHIPAIGGIIERRILANWRVDPAVLAGVLPPPFRPQMVKGVGIAGVCLIRLSHLRPAFLPPVLGLTSENAAHRIAVEWDVDGQRRHGVYVPRRDTDSRLATLAGGRVFPGVHHHARFTVCETAERLGVTMDSDDGLTHVALAGHVGADLPASSVFSSLAEASAFFEAGSLGYSAAQTAGRYDGLELRCKGWNVQPLVVERTESSFFGDRQRFPVGSAEFDCALLMRGIEHEWHGQESLCCDESSIRGRNEKRHQGMLPVKFEAAILFRRGTKWSAFWEEKTPQRHRGTEAQRRGTESYHGFLTHARDAEPKK